VASLHMVIDSALAAQKPPKVVVASKPRIRDYEKGALNREAILEVLKRAARDPAFVVKLTHHGSKALQDYELTLEEKAALLSGDINWIESRTGKLEVELKTWLNCRLQQEIW
jgi:hypothetical protein